MHFLHIIYSKKSNKYYTGETSDIHTRLEFHNNHHNKKAFTSSANDWVMKFTYKTSSKEDAIFLEKFIKRMKSRKFIEKIILNPLILAQILAERS